MLGIRGHAQKNADMLCHPSRFLSPFDGKSVEIVDIRTPDRSNDNSCLFSVLILILKGNDEGSSSLVLRLCVTSKGHRCFIRSYFDQRCCSALASSSSHMVCPTIETQIQHLHFLSYSARSIWPLRRPAQYGFLHSGRDTSNTTSARRRFQFRESENSSSSGQPLFGLRLTSNSAILASIFGFYTRIEDAIGADPFWYLPPALLVA